MKFLEKANTDLNTLNLAIWKSQDLHLSIGIGIAKIILSLTIFLGKLKYKFKYTTMFFLVLSYSASVSLCYNYSLLFYFLFIHLEHLQCSKKKICLNFRKQSFISVLKKKLLQKLLEISNEKIHGVVFKV